MPFLIFLHPNDYEGRKYVLLVLITILQHGNELFGTEVW